MTSFLLGRRRFRVFDEDFSILLTKAECLIVRLSFLDEEKSASSSVGVGGATCGRAARDDFARAEVRFFTVMGAWNDCQHILQGIIELELTIVSDGRAPGSDLRASYKS